VLSLSVGKVLLSYLNKCMQSGKAPNETCDYLENIFDYLSEVKQPILCKNDLRKMHKVREVLRYNVAFNVANTG
jgi:acyl-CoA oxidase